MVKNKGIVIKCAETPTSGCEEGCLCPLHLVNSASTQTDLLSRGKKPLFFPLWLALKLCTPGHIGGSTWYPAAREEPPPLPFPKGTELGPAPQPGLGPVRAPPGLSLTPPRAPAQHTPSSLAGVSWLFYLFIIIEVVALFAMAVVQTGSGTIETDLSSSKV